MVALPSTNPPPLPAAALQRLFRHHPKLHPESAAAAEFRQLGLGKLPFLEWEVEQPWGRLVDEHPLPVLTIDEPLSPTAPVVFPPPTGRDAPPVVGTFCPQGVHHVPNSHTEGLSVPFSASLDLTTSSPFINNEAGEGVGTFDEVIDSQPTVNEPEEDELFQQGSVSDDPRGKLESPIVSSYGRGRRQPMRSSRGSARAQRSPDSRQQQQQPQQAPAVEGQHLTAIDAEEAALLEALGGLDARLAGVSAEQTEHVEIEAEVETLAEVAPVPPAPLPRGSPAVPRASGTRQPRPPRPPRS